MIKYYVKEKGIYKFLEGYIVDGKSYWVSSKEQKDLRLFKKVDKYYIYEKEFNKEKLKEYDKPSYCNESLKEFFFDTYLHPSEDLFKEQEQEQNQSCVTKAEWKEEMEKLEKLIKGLNKELLKCYCMNAYKAGYEKGYKDGKENFEEWFKTI